MNAVTRLSVPLMASALLFLAACSREEAPPPAPRPMLTMVVGAAASGEVRSYAGEVRSKIEQTLAFRIAGKLAERRVDAGDSVRAGQVIARLDPVDAALAAGSADAQRALAEADAARYRELKARNFVSQAALDSRETALKASAAQADLARNQSAYTTLRADQPGVVAQLLAEVGQVLAAGQPVVRVSRNDLPEVAIAVPEAQRAGLRPGTPAEIVLWADESRRYRGVVREIAANADAQTRTYAVRVAIGDADARIALGMSATVEFRSDAGGARITVPQGAIMQKDGKPAVWLVAGDATVSLRPVTMGRYLDETVVVESGLAAGERIVVAGVHKLAEGEKIRIAEAGTAAR